MDDKEFLKSIDYKKRNLHKDNLEDLLRSAIDPSKYGSDPEYGDDESGATSSTQYTITTSNGKYSVPRQIPQVNRGDHQKKMAIYYSDQKNFLTLMPLDDSKFKLVNGEAQNHFTPEMVYYLGVLYDEIINKIPDKDGNRIVITSGFRSIEYNQHLRNNGGGAAQWSAHSGGMAADIVCSKRENRIKILDAAYMIGFGGLGLYDTFVHVDMSGRYMWGGYKGPNGG